MDLRSGSLFWPTTCRRLVLRSASLRERAVDVLIVGAGVTGALVAYELTKAGASVAVVDSRPIASGSTPASTALVQYEIDVPLAELGKRLGLAHARAAYREARLALDDIARVDDELGGGLDLAARPSLQLAAEPGDVRRMRAEVAQRRGLSMPVEWLSRRTLKSRFGFDAPGAILSHEGYEVNPLKLTYRAVGAARERGASVLPRTRLDLGCLVESRRPFRLRLSDGACIVAASVVIATGYETPEQFREIAHLTELRSTFALATQPLRVEPWPQRALLWEVGDPYFYARTTADGRVLVGGEDEPFTTATARDALIAAKSVVLSRKLRERIPTIAFRTAYRWTGTFAQTTDGLPYIGEHPKWPDVYFALGYGGNGITFSLIAAKIIAAAVQGKAHPAGRLFRFDR